jgi:hypothetical protein
MVGSGAPLGWHPTVSMRMLNRMAAAKNRDSILDLAFIFPSHYPSAFQPSFPQVDGKWVYIGKPSDGIIAC